MAKVYEDMFDEDVRITREFWEKVLNTNDIEFHEHMCRYLKLHPGNAFMSYMTYQSSKVNLPNLYLRAKSFFEVYNN
jgi:hypothetical protein